MKKSKRVFCIIAVFLLSCVGLTAQENNETALLSEGKNSPVPFIWPIICIYGGYPEYLSGDLGISVMYKNTNTSELVGANGWYVNFNVGTNFTDVFFRASTGFNQEALGLLGWRFGLGYGIMPKNDKLLSTLFIEATGQLFLFNLKAIVEFPLGPDNLCTYYKEKYISVKICAGIGF
ncbi:hypothetical protein [Treponema sp.]|uniref:hypothetical protein n=1 Tax=Treponema sp. TaxID=166 RepID=UPI00298EC07A|nr:hypothetical protein [Treponema sp.]MCR5612712.1 hypothetical protein [Treponema sp.]